MDKQLQERVNDGPDAKASDASGKQEIERTARGNDPDRSTAEIVTMGVPGSAGQHDIKPLAELYGPGTGRDSLDPTDDVFLPLLMGIEEVFVDAFVANPALTDGAVIAALDRLCMTPEANVAGDVLASAVQVRLRLALSFNDYSRQDVKLALRKIKQSVNRHNRLGGTRGYLTFIRAQLRR